MKRLVFALLLLFSSGTAVAQGRLLLKRLINNWPKIELYYTMTCGAQRIFSENVGNYKLSENGNAITTYSVDCREPDLTASLALALIVDGSTHMGVTGIKSAQAAAKAILHMIDSSSDIASLRVFDDSTVLYRSMTSLSDSLIELIDSVREEGNAKLYDAVYAGIDDAGGYTCKQARAVLIMSNGHDDGSTHSIDSCIIHARRKGIVIYAFGLGVDIDDAPLRTLCDNTGGLYFANPNPALCTFVYQQMVAMWGGDFTECIISYEAKCMDGEHRYVDFAVHDTCGLDTTVTRAYIAPLDLSLPSISARLGKSSGIERQYVEIPIHLDAADLGDTLPPFRCTILFMEGVLRFDYVTAPKGSLLEGIPITSATVKGGIEIQSRVPVVLRGRAFPALIANLGFYVLQSPLWDTLRTPLVFSTWSFDSGCYRTTRTNGEVLIVPRGPTTVPGMPQNVNLAVYPEPNPGRFTVRLHLDAPQPITIQVRNVLGQIVHETTKLEGTGEHTFTIDLGNAPSGVYVLENGIGMNRTVKKISVLR